MAAASCPKSCCVEGGSCNCALRLVTKADANCAPIQAQRRLWKPTLPQALLTPVKAEVDAAVDTPALADAATLEAQFPKTWGQKLVKLVPGEASDFSAHRPLRMGVVLSGGQAAGGHNVIAGVYDYIMQCHKDSKLFGFKSGPHGLFTQNYVELSREVIDSYRNMGGFDMICSGRHKIETEEQKQASMAVCNKLDLDGLIIIGGDDSNTNGAILAEYFKAQGCKTLVAGAPKTIDGDLKNEYIEISFGFDTAVKVYSELVGNLCVDARTHKDRYHFVRLMGRSASNIGLEVALQTRPNLCFVGEEIQAQNRSLVSICQEIADMVEKRHSLGKDFGVVLLPEGLIEFIPEVGSLIAEINDILGDGSAAFDQTKFTPNSKAVFEAMPEAIRGELLLERDSHGNVQVAKIATERLLILMTQAELKKRGHKGRFFPHDHYFGYEGRCAMPSNFDANYCYSLGHTAAALIDNKLTGYMAVVRHLENSASEWTPAGCPVIMMMNIERRKGKDVPVIKKYLVELDKAPFTTFKEVREVLKTEDFYRNPGPIQFEGISADVTNYMISYPSRDWLLRGPADAETANFIVNRPTAGLLLRNAIAKSEDKNSASLIPEERFVANEPVPAVLKSDTVALKLSGVESAPHDVGVKLERSNVKIGIVCATPAFPGANNVLQGVVARATAAGASVCVFDGVEGLISGKPAREVSSVADCPKNLGGFVCSSSSKPVKGNEAAIVEACKKLTNLASIIFLGDSTCCNDQMKQIPNSVYVPVHCNNSAEPLSGFSGVCCGFDTVAKTYAALVGNLLTDAASAHKYWYFVKVMGDDSVALEVACQTHVNHCLISSACPDLETAVKSIADVVVKRSNSNKNFGCVLIPESLGDLCLKRPSSDFPEFFSEAIAKPTPSGIPELSELPIDRLMAHLVGEELKKRTEFKGAYAPVTYYMGLQARSATPSRFDCVLGTCYGHLAALAALQDDPSMRCVAVTNTFSDSVDDWHLRVLSMKASGQASTKPVLAAMWRSQQDRCANEEAYCNPGPIQFTGEFSKMVSNCVLTTCEGQCLKEKCKCASPQHTATDISDAVVHA